MACIAKRRGRYIIDFYDTEGKRRWKTMPQGSTKAKAKEALRAIEEQLLKGIYLPSKKTPIFSKVAGDWLNYKRANIRITTWEMYRGHLQHHFDEINSLKINRISTAIVENFISKRQANNMNITTLRKIIITFNQIMNYSVRHKYIDHNPVRDAERPKSRGLIETHIVEPLSTTEINILLSAEKDMKYKTLFTLAIMSGARQGELLGFKWTDVDWKNNQIYIQRTYNKGRWFMPKSKASNRRIDLGPSMIDELKKWKIDCLDCELELMFPNQAGNPMSQSGMLKRHFFPVLKKAGVKRIRFHDLRHTYASLLIEQGENIKYIQSQLGHSSPTMTLN
nr:site-specific integrase [Desulfobacterales bacterium]